MSVKKARIICWWLTVLLYVAGLYLPLAEGDRGMFLVLPPCFLCCFMASPLGLFAFAASENPDANMALFVLIWFLPLALAHSALWWSWWAYYRRKPVAASVASGLAAVLWLVPVWGVGLLIGGWSELFEHAAGYWCSFVGIAGMCLLAILTHGPMRAEDQATRAEEQAARAAAESRDAKIAALLTERAEGRADPSDHG